MEEAFAIKDSLAIKLSNYDFGLAGDGSLQSVVIQTEDKLDLDTMNGVVEVLENNMGTFRLDVDITDGRIRARVE